MKEYIVLSVNDSHVYLDYKTISDEEKKYLNKNNFDNGFLYFTYNYFIKHTDKICSFLLSFGTYESFTIKKLVIFNNCISFITRLKIKKLYLDFPSTLSINEYSLFLKNNNLKEIHCYYMPTFILNKFKNNGVAVNLYNKYKVSDRFMIQEDSFDYETLYYIKNLKIKENYPTILEDIKEFLKINRSLKAIHIYTFSKELLEGISKLVNEDESRNIIIFLHQSYDKGDFITNNFSWLKELNKKYKKDYICEFRIIYSNDFLGKNLFKQLTFNNLKLISIFGIYICAVCLIITKSYDYVEKMNIEKLNNELINESFAAPNEMEIELGDVIEEAPDEEDEITEKEIKTKYTFDKAFSKLKKINKETVGYLVVNGTKISYPIVQHSDNSYYLKYDFYKVKRSMGWVYLDYRNNPKDFDDNNIIYGHAMYNGTMFGTLNNVLKSSFRKNEENMIISYDTPDGEYKFKIFAGYRVDYTTDYLKTNFDNKKDFDDFVKMLKNRSSFKSNVPVNYGDKILTLSTCAGSGNQNKRLAIHAVLIKEE